MNSLVLLRHAQRGDTHTTPTYDPSLSETGLAQARGAGDDVSEYLSSNDMDVVIHSSPYLRCLQTSVELAHRLQAAHSGKVSLKVDHALSEWLHSNLKFVPPLDNGLSLEADVAKIQSTMPLASNVAVDLTWNTAALGSFNSYGVSYYEYRESINRYIRNLTSYYTSSRKPMLIIVVTHGIAVNCLLQFLLNKSLFHEVPEAKISIAKQVSVGQWLLVRNCLGLANGPENTSTLSIPKDYETTFSSNASSEKKSAEKDFSELTYSPAEISMGNSTNSSNSSGVSLYSLEEDLFDSQEVVYQNLQSQYSRPSHMPEKSVLEHIYAKYVYGHSEGHSDVLSPSDEGKYAGRVPTARESSPEATSYTLAFSGDSKKGQGPRFEDSHTNPKATESINLGDNFSFTPSLINPPASSKISTYSVEEEAGAWFGSNR